MPEHFDTHIVKRYDGELNHLHYLVLEMGDLVLRQIREALTAFKHRDVGLAHQVMSSDRLVDQMEVHADEEIVKLIARRAPVGGDLRMVMAVSKSISDLERIGDEAVRIASLGAQMFGPDGNDPGNRLLRDVAKMGELALGSLGEALEVFEVWDEAKALDVLARYREMEDEFQADLRRLMTYIIEDSRNIGLTIGVVLVIKALERIGHHAHNLAEYVIFQVKGEDIRATGIPAPDDLSAVIKP